MYDCILREAFIQILALGFNTSTTDLPPFAVVRCEFSIGRAIQSMTFQFSANLMKIGTRIGMIVQGDVYFLGRFHSISAYSHQRHEK